MTSDDFGLTARDLDMLQGLADGVTTTEMAERLGITANGVRSAIKRVVMWAYCRGLTPPGFVTWAFNRFRLWNE